MKHLNQKIYATFSLSNKKYIVKGTPMDNIISSIFCTNLDYDINDIALVNRLQSLQCKKLFIFDIIPFGEESITLVNNHMSYLPISKENPYYINQIITLNNFFKKEFFTSLLLDKKERLNNEPIINNSIFVFHVLPYSFLCACFKLNNFLLTGGANNRRHLLSVLDYRLSNFIVCAESMNKNTVFDSYHNYLNLGIQPVFNHSILDKIDSFKDIGEFFIVLEKYIKLKLKVNSDTEHFS